MGTSISQGSPATTSWRAVLAMYRGDFPPERVASEVWRAAAADAEANWADLLASGAVRVFRDIAASGGDASEAVMAASREVALHHETNFGAEMARLALLNAIGDGRPAQRFVRELFEFTTDYLVSRDLSGYVGQRYPNRTVEEAAVFRERVRSEVGDRVDALTRELHGDESETWAPAVRGIVAALAGRGPHAR